MSSELESFENQLEFEEMDKISTQTHNTTEIEESVKTMQKSLTKMLYMCYNEGADKFLKDKAQEQQDNEKDEDDFIIVETSDLDSQEDYKRFSNNLNKLDPNSNSTGSDNIANSQRGIWNFNGKSIFQSNYFSFNRSTTSEVKKDESPSKKSNDENFGDLKLSLEEEVGYAVSDKDESSDSDENDVKLGTLYFYESRRSNLKHLSSSDAGKMDITKRRNSLEETKLNFANQFLQMSVAPEQLDVDYFYEEKWLEVYSLITHKALVMMMLAKILNI